MTSHAVNRVMLAGAALAGAGVVATLWPAVAAAGAVAGVFAGVGGNFLHQCGDDLAKALRDSPARAADYLHNEDLRRLVGQTIAGRLRALSDDQALSKPARDRLKMLAIKAEEGGWRYLTTRACAPSTSGR